jgi:glutaredoxin
MKASVLIVIAYLCYSVALAQTVYKSIGPDGNVVYSDHPPADGKVDKTFNFVELPSSPVPDLPADSANTSGKKAMPTQPVVPRDGVLMYSASWCGYCKRAKAYLAKNHIAYSSVDIDTADGRSSFQEVGKGSVPLLFWGKRRIRGFTAEGYDAFFGVR